ncbi:protein NUCLEAR FUSION DEFECTIVE 5, mitochondrial [Dorcoceras hygrometricum]|uniref:Protein NUCLEAR FUSION DEFECTIVE 5, mitochondrial n=1 Tax=Dorcoceras hygrometricum TaxID=472368 RepID=A0A2Z7BAB8_9LAMI|nr:protein NUCLEAR FUSION DEFECTIVE 5, mitochondrial [Dorcoceras hygrometricum]
MNLRHLSKRTVISISRLHGRVFSSYSGGDRSIITSIVSTPTLTSSPGVFSGTQYLKFDLNYGRHIHTVQQDNFSSSFSYPDSESENDASMNEFLSRFAWSMRQKVNEVYPASDKETIDGMLLIIIEKVVSEMEKGGLEQMIGVAASTPSPDFSEDLWRTVWEVSNAVLQDMVKEKKKEKMKVFLQSEEVKEMYRFAGEVGVRGDMLRELRFKWAREKMEESEFYQSLERLREEHPQIETPEENHLAKENIDRKEGVGYASDVAEDKPKTVTLPKRHGKIKYKIYGLDLSDPKWVEVADKVQESGKVIWPQEPKQISGKCKLLTERILSLQEDEDPTPLLSEWVGLLQPSRIDWINFLDRLKQQNPRLHFKGAVQSNQYSGGSVIVLLIAEIVLGEESFQTSIHDYSKLVDALARENRYEDAERILKKMDENGIVPDVLTSTIMVHMYSKSGNLDRAKEAYDSFRARGFQPDANVYHSMIMAHVNAGDPKTGDLLLKKMEASGIKPTKEIYMALLRSFAHRGEVNLAQHIATAMQFAGFQPSLESYTLLVEAYGRAGDPEQARNTFDHMMKLGHRPDDRCTASMIAAYANKVLLDKALDLLLELEKGGFEPGVSTYSVLIDWFGRMQLIDEAEQILDKIIELGEAPPVEVHISLWEMYSRAGFEKKALQALGVVESKKEQLGYGELERIINSLLTGGLIQDARRMHEYMVARGFVPSEKLKMDLASNAAFPRRRTSR